MEGEKVHLDLVERDCMPYLSVVRSIDFDQIVFMADFAVTCSADGLLC